MRSVLKEAVFEETYLAAAEKNCLEKSRQSIIL